MYADGRGDQNDIHEDRERHFSQVTVEDRLKAL